MYLSRSESENDTGAVVMAATVFALLDPLSPFLLTKFFMMNNDFQSILCLSTVLQADGFKI